MVNYDQQFRVHYMNSADLHIIVLTDQRMDEQTLPIWPTIAAEIRFNYVV